LLWKYLGWQNEMPEWAHLPLILKPDGHGKLSKRDGDRLGFPVFAMDWTDPKTNEKAIGFKERGFLPEAFVNLLAVLGWNDGTDQEIFSMTELIEKFSIDRVHKGGAKFDYEKAKWFNAEWIKNADNAYLAGLVQPYFEEAGIKVQDQTYLEKIIGITKERCILLPDFITQAGFYFAAPTQIDTASIAPKWDDNKKNFFEALCVAFENSNTTDPVALENIFKELTATHGLKPGELMLPMRIMLVGGKFGPAVFEIAATIGISEAVARIKHALTLL
jgi:glutamyl-tRNA synthetase